MMVDDELREGIMALKESTERLEQSNRELRQAMFALAESVADLSTMMSLDEGEEEEETECPGVSRLYS